MRPLTIQEIHALDKMFNVIVGELAWTQFGTVGQEAAVALKRRGFCTPVGKSATGEYWSITPDEIKAFKELQPCQS